ncbi:hypothetical protein, partial [Polaromonas sp.]|uniref:hypothetical protein n=1 Tax=Polaromonas sp. TaxID=1869339 RepID=UPI002730CFCC
MLALSSTHTAVALPSCRSAVVGSLILSSILFLLRKPLDHIARHFGLKQSFSFGTLFLSSC